MTSTSLFCSGFNTHPSLFLLNEVVSKNGTILVEYSQVTDSWAVSTNHCFSHHVQSILLQGCPLSFRREPFEGWSNDLPASCFTHTPWRTFHPVRNLFSSVSSITCWLEINNCHPSAPLPCRWSVFCFACWHPTAGYYGFSPSRWIPQQEFHEEMFVLQKEWGGWAPLLYMWGVSCLFL